MPGVSIGSSVIKRENRPISEVESKLMKDGWDKTGSALGGRLLYFEKSGINITVLGGPMATIIFPSGPVRGAIFGEDAVGLNTTSVIGAGARTKADKGKDVRNEGKADQLT